MDKVKELIDKLTLEEKATLLCGQNPMYTNSLDRLNIPSLEFSDGPHGVRKINKDGDSLGGIGNSLPTTCFPTAATSACSFNRDNLYRMGQALGEECLYYNINVLLGPAVNIQRNLYCGRNFEYFSEDPFLAGEMGIQQVKGIQSMGVGTSLKHFACNNNEQFRMYGDSVVDERALREIYLKPFEKVVKEAHPTTLMCAYNKLNGTFCSENKYLLQSILRDEWKFKGLVMSDWGAVKDRDRGVDAGLDLEMPGSIKYNVEKIVASVKNKSLSMERVDCAVGNLLNLINNAKIRKVEMCDFAAHHKVSLNIAEDSAVLFKNEENILPLKKDKKYLVMGDFFLNMRYQGSGSSLINPQKIVTPKDAFDSRNINYEFVEGYKSSEIKKNDACIKKAVNKAEQYDQIIFFGGQSDYIESEGFDREDMKLAENQLSLIDELLKLNKKIIFVMFGGSPIEMPFENGFKAILNMMLPGQAGGEAAASILFGEVNPSGKIAQTWPMTSNDVSVIKDLSEREVSLYKDSIFVGYRYYLSKQIKVRYPFGYGLSYSKFAYSDINVEISKTEAIVTFEIKNSSPLDGKEICQVYVRGPQSDVDKPHRELKGFEKVLIKANESARVSLSIKIDDLKYFDAKQKKWILEPGDYTFEVGKSSEDIVLSQGVKIESLDKIQSNEENKVERYLNMSDEEFATAVNYNKPLRTIFIKRRYTLETPIKEYKTLGGKLIYKIASAGVNNSLKKAERMPEGGKKESAKKSAIFLMKLIPNNSLRSICFSAGGLISYKKALCLLDVANGHIVKGLVKFILTKD
jgi:beta-glucosidase